MATGIDSTIVSQKREKFSDQNLNAKLINIPAEWYAVSLIKRLVRLPGTLGLSPF